MSLCLLASFAAAALSPATSELRQAADVEARDDDRDEVARLVRDAQAGSRDALASLHGRYAGMVHAIAMAHVRHSDASDLTQQTFVVAIRRLHSLRDPKAFGPWLGQIARNTARDHLRRQRPTTSLEHYQPSADALAPKRIDALRMVAAIKELPEQQAEVLLMRLVEGMTGPEIAARLQLAPGTVRVTLHRGMAKLRAQLKRREGGSDS